MKISFVIPCYNSAKNIGGVLNEINNAMQTRLDVDFEIILVSDDKEIYVSDGLTDSFENLSDMKVNIIER